MKSEVISTFKGKINNCEFYDENAFYITKAVLEFIIETHGEVFNNAFIHDLADYVDYLLNRHTVNSKNIQLPAEYEDVQLSVKYYDIQGALECVVDSYDTFQDLRFNLFGLENEYMNGRLKKGMYNKK
jgi:hypothetical protein